ncbi:MAG: thioredoxin [Candidatus Omnitrophica bacterium]|nr:thioredoxin [Candidatus Omnitrophota bacterium]
MLKEITDANFKEEVLQNKSLFLLFFKSPWCPNCKRLVPIIEELSTDYSGRVDMGIYDVINSRQVAVDYAVLTVPTILIFKEAKPIERLSGFVSKDGLKAKIDKLL